MHKTSLKVLLFTVAIYTQEGTVSERTIIFKAIMDVRNCSAKGSILCIALVTSGTSAWS